MKIRVAVVVIALLAACGGPPDRAPRPVSGPPPAADAVTAPNFGDADPHPWDGRPPQSYAVHGIDISRWQTFVDWATARANGVNFAFIKATEGGDMVDPAFAMNWQLAARHGVRRGAYHFFYHCRPAREQARWFIRHVPRAAGALPPVLDMEWTPFSPTCRIRRDPATIRAEARDFLRIVEGHYGQRPIIYTTVDFWRDNELWKVGPYPFWLRSVAAHPEDLYAGRHWTFWQYTSTGLVPGIGGKVDINVFDGSPAEWRAWLAANAP